MPAATEKQARFFQWLAHDPAARAAKGISEKTAREFEHTRSDAEIEACAGILIRDHARQYLLLQDAETHVWAQPGGHAIPGEAPLQTAKRETLEETALENLESLRPFRVSYDNSVVFICYLAEVSDDAAVTLSSESEAFGWFAANALPEGVHPEVARSIQILEGTEFDLAHAMVDGGVLSPQVLENSWLYALRITGTGTAYRRALDEYVYRPPENFLTPEFVERCQGLPVVRAHPQRGILAPESFAEDIIGTVILPYLKGDEVWGIARILDGNAATAMLDDLSSTSPAVVFRPEDAEGKAFVGGSALLVEGIPSRLDHLAVCPEGVWDKEHQPSGVDTSSADVMQENVKSDAQPTRQSRTTSEAIMANNEELRRELEELKRQVEAACAKLAASEEPKADEDKKEEEHKAGEELDKGAKDKKEGEPEAGKEAEHKAGEELAKAQDDADGKETPIQPVGHYGRARKDEDVDKAPEEIAEADSAARADSQQVRQMIAKLESKLARATRPRTFAERDEMAKVQARCDSVAQALGVRAEDPLVGEHPGDYRRRCAAALQPFSVAAKGVDLAALPEAAFALAEDRIYADAQAAAKSSAAAVDGQLTAVVERDAAGRAITKYFGDPNAWLRPFKARGLHVRFADAAMRRETGVR